MPSHPSGAIVEASGPCEEANNWAFAELFVRSSAAMHAWGEIEQSVRRESIPAAAAGALPEMRRAREAAVDAAIALCTSQDATQSVGQRRALFQRQVRRIAAGRADDFTEGWVFAQQIGQTFTHEMF